ncbi:helix-turn-helix transcriptional regulator [Pendulispora albinea]|uniref:AraC family transcriptional regulator n=1 Tax=Pendulispora albinea TaxID=2741071 RepID=A0ABZ2M815_9BACT
MTSHARQLPIGSKLIIHEIHCQSPRSGRGPLRGGEATHLVFVRRGAFASHVGSREYIADPCTALIAWEETEYRISHPGDAGDDCTVLELGPELAHEILGRLEPRRDFAMQLSPQVQAAYAALWTVLARAHGDVLACEEAALELMFSALDSARPRIPAATKSRRATALAAIELLNDDLAANRPVSALAEEIGCSPSHLMHAFRAEIGATLRGYRLQLRLAAALHRIAAGEDNLAGLAAELGFASHAHLTDTFAHLVGIPPRDVRAWIQRDKDPSASSMRRFLEARIHRRA